MKNTGIILVLIITLSSCSNQFCKECGASGLIALKHQAIPIYKEPGQTIIDYIIDDTLKESYHLLLIKKIKSKYAYIGVEKNENKEVIYGWIPLDVIAIRPAVYSENMNLYEKPNSNSKIQAVISRPPWTYYYITKCAGEWLYVKVESHGKSYSGWMRPQDQCSNPYSTCN